jgi:hypothetical protein
LYIASRPREALPAIFGLGRRVSGAARPAANDEEHGDAARMRDVRDRTRLAELLLARGSANAAAASMELDRIDSSGAPLSPEARDWAAGDPGVRWLRARSLEEAGRREEGEALVADPRQVIASYGPWWALRGRWARLRGAPGDDALANASFLEAIAADPLYPEAACETVDPAAVVPDAAKAALCEAARARGEPAFGGD